MTERGLPTEVKFCKKCTISNQRPRITFDEEGICSACKFGLRGFSQSIREETLNNNVKVSIINPGMVKTPFFKELNFIHGKNSDEFIEASDIAKVVLDILNLRDGTVIEEINLSPLKKVFESNKN